MREKGHACRSLASWQEFGSDMFDRIVGHICGQGLVKVWSRCGSSWNYWCCDYSHCPCAFLGPDYFVLPRYDIMYIYTLSCSVFTKKSTVSSLYCGVPAGYG